MNKLRDIELRWSSDTPAPEWFWKRGVLQYMFCQELRKLTIETPQFSKINVYYDPAPTVYSGYVFDAVTDVHVAMDWKDVEGFSSNQFNEKFLALLLKGLKIVFDLFHISTEALEAIAGKLRGNGFYLDVLLGTRSSCSRNKEYSARLHVQSDRNLESCLIVAVVSKRRKLVGELIICTTFPFPEYAIDQFKSLEWLDETHLTATFEIYGKPSDKEIFGRRMFDCRGYSSTVYCLPADEKNLALVTDVSLYCESVAG